MQLLQSIYVVEESNFMAKQKRKELIQLFRDKKGRFRGVSVNGPLINAYLVGEPVAIPITKHDLPSNYLRRVVAEAPQEANSFERGSARKMGDEDIYLALPVQYYKVSRQENRDLSKEFDLNQARGLASLIG